MTDGVLIRPPLEDTTEGTATLMDVTPGSPGTHAHARAERVRQAAPEVAVAAASLVVFSWSLSRNGLGNDYYAAAARSMTTGWKQFVYGALDPGGWITVDKPPFALWFQALSAKVFGLSSWSLLLPSAVAGAVAVLLLTITVRRVWGRTAGLVAGIALALTPVVVAVSRSNNPDGFLMLCAVAAAASAERAITTGRARWMVACGALCGLGFLTKLLAVGLVMPGLWAAYLVAARAPWRRRVAHLLLATAAFGAVGGVWLALGDLVPAGSRPYIGGSTDGTASDLLFGYNGFGRLNGSEGGPGGGRGPGGFGSGRGPGGFGAGGGGFVVDEFGGTPGVSRLFNNGMGDQVMWLAPVAAAAAVGGLVASVRRRRLDARVGSLVLLTGWAGVTYLVFAFAEGIFHNYYVSFLAPALAGLVGVGSALLREAGRAGRLLAAAALVVTAVLQQHLLQRVAAHTWLRTVVPVGLVALALVWVVVALDRSVDRRLPLAALGATAVLALTAPAVWSWSGTQVAQSGTFPAARPEVNGAGLALGFPAGGPGGGTAGGPAGASDGTALPAGGLGGGFGGGLDAQLLDWLRTQRTNERWLIAVGSSMQADAAIIGGDSVMPMGGFSGSDPAMTVERLADLVADGDLRFVLGGGAGFGGGPGAGVGGFGGTGGGVATAVAQACQVVDPATWGASGGAAGASVYDCLGAADDLRGRA